MVKKKVGTIVTPPGVFTDVHEKMAADFLAVALGADITFIRPSRKHGQKTPDIDMIGARWEIKAPKGKGSRTIENTLRQASKQSRYVILDLRRMDGRIPTDKFLKEIERQFYQNRGLQRAIVITRQEKIVDYVR